jgi:hypothetical protein
MDRAVAARTAPLAKVDPDGRPEDDGQGSRYVRSRRPRLARKCLWWHRLPFLGIRRRSPSLACRAGTRRERRLCTLATFAACSACRRSSSCWLAAPISTKGADHIFAEDSQTNTDAYERERRPPGALTTRPDPKSSGFTYSPRCHGRICDVRSLDPRKWRQGMRPRANTASNLIRVDASCQQRVRNQ